MAQANSWSLEELALEVTITEQGGDGEVARSPVQKQSVAVDVHHYDGLAVNTPEMGQVSGVYETFNLLQVY